MIDTSTEIIWTIRGDNLSPRKGNIVIEPEYVSEESDTESVIRVESGLVASDLIVFLRYTPGGGEEEDLPENPVGYIVTAVDKNGQGSGVLVNGERFESHPPTWVNERVIGAFALIADEITPADFDLPELHNYLQSLRVLKSS